MSEELNNLEDTLTFRLGEFEKLKRENLLEGKKCEAKECEINMDCIDWVLRKIKELDK